MNLILTILIILFFPLISSAQEHGCLSKCIARGGMVEDCNQQCGIVTHGSVNVPEPPRVINTQDPLSAAIEDNVALEPDSQKVKEVFEDCYQNTCLKGFGGLPLEECIANCTKIAKLRSGKTEKKVEEDKTYGVDTDCFRICKKEAGETTESCNETCKKFEK